MPTPKPSNDLSANPTANDDGTCEALDVVAEQLGGMNARLDATNARLDALVRALDTPAFRAMVETQLSVIGSLQKAVESTAKRVENLSSAYSAPSVPEPGIAEQLTALAPLLQMVLSQMPAPAAQARPAAKRKPATT